MQLLSWNEQRLGVFKDRYAMKDADGNIIEASPSQMFKRIAHNIAMEFSERANFEEILNKMTFVPSGRILSNDNTLYNCFVLGIQPSSEYMGVGRDSRQGIMSTITRMVEITSRGGGVGINWSTLRPRGTLIKGVNGLSSGATTWMHGADALADAIRQGGSRTAALMFVLDVWHPDILDFVTDTNFDRANFSVNVSEEFMDAIREDRMFELRFPDTADPRYNSHWDGNLDLWVTLGGRVKTYNTLPARMIWDAIVSSAHKSGNPGVIFLDRSNHLSNTWYLDELICTNPCGEQPLPPNGCCNLGSINLLALADSNGDIAIDELRETVTSAVRFLDNVIDKSGMISPEIQRTQATARRIGLGTMGLADVLILRGIRYGSEESLTFIDDIYSYIRNFAYEASVSLAKEKGPAPGFDFLYTQGKFIQTLPSRIQGLIASHGIRNLALLTQAPTGTTSVLAGASSGIEPIFSDHYERTDATGTHKMKHPLFEKTDIDPKALVTAMNVTPEEHILVQARIQQYLDSSISKTINLPNDCIPGDISKAYIRAYESGCKGITVYRTGCRGEEVLTTYCEECQI